MSTAIEYEYSDGSANRYVLTADSLEYIPVQPHESSTGFYSGGEPKKKSITHQTYKLIKRALDAVVANKTIHTDKRAMMTGVVRIKSRQLNVILSPCAELTAIDSLLKAALH